MASMMNYYQIIMVGDSGVGKTSLIKKFVNNEFKKYGATVGADINFVDVHVVNNKNGKNIESNKMVIWDTEGQERFDSLAENYFRRAEGVIVVYDVTDQKSFFRCTSWILKVKEYAKATDIQYILVGNKIDNGDKRIISYTDGYFFAKNNDMDFLETSAKNDTNVALVFEKIGKKLFAGDISIKKRENIIKVSSPNNRSSINSQPNVADKRKKRTTCSCV